MKDHHDNRDESKQIPFDSEKYGKEALTKYTPVKSRYEEFARKMELVLNELLHANKIRVHSVTSRAKDEDSFLKKAQKPNPDNPNKPYYSDPLNEITDLAGVRIITYFLQTAELVSNLVESEFEVIEKSDRMKELLAQDKFGYQSIHYLVKLSKPRVLLPEYRNFSNMICEVQVRTILQHAWAEIEHDIQYKTRMDIPAEIRRRFLNLAGLIEITDREFQFIHEEDDRLKQQLYQSLETGKLEEVEITGQTLKYLLDKLLGPDARLTEWSYSFAAKIVHKMGVTSLSGLKQIIENADIEAMRGKLWDWRPSPTMLLEYILLFHFKEKFIQNHPWAEGKDSKFWVNLWREYLVRMYGEDYNRAENKLSDRPSDNS